MTAREIARRLNSEGLVPTKGHRYTERAIEWIRRRHGITVNSLRRPGEVTIKQLANELNVSVQWVHYWIKHSVIAARQLGAGGRLLVNLTGTLRADLQRRIQSSGHLRPRSM